MGFVSFVSLVAPSASPPCRGCSRWTISAGQFWLLDLRGVRYGYVTGGMSSRYGVLAGGLMDTYGTCVRTLTSYGSL
jgi:hypothetical protein